MIDRNDKHDSFFLFLFWKTLKLFSYLKFQLEVEILLEDRFH